jgi:hypothetical protein
MAGMYPIFTVKSNIPQYSFELQMPFLSVNRVDGASQGVLGVSRQLPVDLEILQDPLAAKACQGFLAQDPHEFVD